MFEEWVAAEEFYTFTLPLILIVLAMLFFVYIFFLSYIGDKRRVIKIGNVTVVLVVISCVVYFVNGHTNYHFGLNRMNLLTLVLENTALFWE